MRNYKRVKTSSWIWPHLNNLYLHNACPPQSCENQSKKLATFKEDGSHDLKQCNSFLSKCNIMNKKLQLFPILRNSTKPSYCFLKEECIYFLRAYLCNKDRLLGKKDLFAYRWKRNAYRTECQFYCLEGSVPLTCELWLQSLTAGGTLVFALLFYSFCFSN